MELLKREHISDQLVEIIGNQIIRNELKPGVSIYETRLSKAYGISRSPVRDALHTLRQVRLVERNERGNYQVTVLTPAVIENLYDTANIIFQYAFSKAAERAKPEDLQDMGKHLEALERSIQGKDIDLYLSNATELAKKILIVAGNPIVEKIALELMPNAERLQWASISHFPDQLQKVVNLLIKTYAMVASRKPIAAARAFKNFAGTLKTLVLKTIGDRQN
jgi:DNA-binding GntR family transcriptional regulator